jgi:hypothetical protein
MDKALLRVLFPLLMLATILAFALALSPSASGSAHNSPGATPHPDIRPVGGHHAAGATATPTPTGEGRSQPGSTDGLVIMSFALVVIIVIPILLQRALWKS